MDIAQIHFNLKSFQFVIKNPIYPDDNAYTMITCEEVVYAYNISVTAVEHLYYFNGGNIYPTAPTVWRYHDGH